MRQAMTVNDVMEALKIKKREVISRLIREKRIHGVKIGNVWRIDPDSVDRFLSGPSSPPPPSQPRPARRTSRAERFFR